MGVGGGGEEFKERLAPNLNVSPCAQSGSDVAPCRVVCNAVKLNALVRHFLPEAALHGGCLYQVWPAHAAVEVILDTGEARQAVQQDYP